MPHGHQRESPDEDVNTSQRLRPYRLVPVQKAKQPPAADPDYACVGTAPFFSRSSIAPANVSTSSSVVYTFGVTRSP